MFFTVLDWEEEEWCIPYYFSDDPESEMDMTEGEAAISYGDEIVPGISESGGGNYPARACAAGVK